MNNPLYEHGPAAQTGSGGYSTGRSAPTRPDAGQADNGNQPAAPPSFHVLPDAGTGADVATLDTPPPPISVDGSGTGGADAVGATDGTPATPPAFEGDLRRGLALYLPLDEETNTSVAADASGKKATAVLKSIDPVAAWIDGPATTGRALALQGASWNGWLDVNGQALQTALSESFSVALWINRPAAASAPETLVSRYSLGARGALLVLGLENGALSVKMNTTAAYSFRTQSNGAVPTGRWVHVAMTYDRKQVRLYVDGNASGAALYEQALPLDTTSIMVGGLEQQNRSVAARFAGQIDEVLVYTRVLTGAEIDGLARGARPRP